MIKKICLLCWGILLIFVSVGCTKVEKSNSSSASKYNSPYTLCGENKDGTYNLYVYSAPVQYKKNSKYEMKNLSVVKSDNKKYSFMNQGSDICTYFPKKLTQSFSIQNNNKKIEFRFDEKAEEFHCGVVTDYVNIYEDVVSAVIYENEKGMQIVCYPTIDGIQFEYCCSEKCDWPEFEFVCKNTSLLNNDGYIVMDGNEKFVIYKPLSLENNNELSFEYDIKYKKDGDKTRFSFIRPENITNEEIRLTFSIEKYVDKIPDSSIYSKKDENSYLRNYAVIGKNEDFGLGYHYLRFRLGYLFDIDSEDIIKAEYYVRQLDCKRKTPNLVLCENNQQWSSTRVTWSEQKKYKDFELSTGVRNQQNWIGFDITQFVRNCFNDRRCDLESMGCRLRIKDDDNKYAVIATSDNAMYVPYVKLLLKKLPEKFNSSSPINPPIS